jgi:hypothetical protein
MGARYYDAALGRFISADTIIASLANPQSLNRYAYAYNNPINNTDPTGHWVPEGGEPNPKHPSKPKPPSNGNNNPPPNGGNHANDYGGDEDKHGGTPEKPYEPHTLPPGEDILDAGRGITYRTACNLYGCSQMHVYRLRWREAWFLEEVLFGIATDVPSDDLKKTILVNPALESLAGPAALALDEVYNQLSGSRSGIAKNLYPMLREVVGPTMLREGHYPNVTIALITNVEGVEHYDVPGYMMTGGWMLLVPRDAIIVSASDGTLGRQGTTLSPLWRYDITRAIGTVMNTFPY